MEKNEIVKSGEGFIDRSKVRILLCDKDVKSSQEVFTLLCKCSYQGNIQLLCLVKFLELLVYGLFDSLMHVLFGDLIGDDLCFSPKASNIISTRLF